jgi:hypothetical protein
MSHAPGANMAVSFLLLNVATLAADAGAFVLSNTLGDGMASRNLDPLLCLALRCSGMCRYTASVGVIRSSNENSIQATVMFTPARVASSRFTTNRFSNEHQIRPRYGGLMVRGLRSLPP